MAPPKPKLELVASNEPPPPPVPAGVPQQVEMPFAVVNGEPVTELPKDLYIPPQALEVFLEAFEGPLDLLLYLIRRQNLDILDIPLAEITKQYMKYIEVMQELQLELAGEYMVMAATLAEIKSRMLLPRPKADTDGTEEDPRAELVRRLQEYERFKRAAEDIDKLERLERDNWVAGAELRDRKVVKLLPQVTLQEMLVAFKEVVVRSEMFSHHHVARERLSVRERMSTILSTLERQSFVEFAHMFKAEEGRMGVTVTFIAILELMREGLVEIVQAEPYAPIHLRSSTEKRNLRLVANNETPEQVAHAAELGETVLEEFAVASLEEEAAALVADVDFVDDTDDEDLEAPIEDFGLDDIKVPEVNFGNAPPGWVPPPGVARRQPVFDELTGEEIPVPAEVAGLGEEAGAVEASGDVVGVADADVADVDVADVDVAVAGAADAAGAADVVDDADAAAIAAELTSEDVAADEVAMLTANEMDELSITGVTDIGRLEQVSPRRSEFDDAGDDVPNEAAPRTNAQGFVDEGLDEAGSEDGAAEDETPGGATPGVGTPPKEGR